MVKKEIVGEDGFIQTKPPKAIGNREHYQRLNYLYQLSMFHRNEGLSRSYVNTMDFISKKTNTKLLPSVKRTYCNKCKRLTMFGSEMKIEKKKNSIDYLTLQCKCGTEKSFPIGLNRDHKTYYEKEGNLLDL